MDRTAKSVLEFLVVKADGGFERADQIADDIFRGIVEQSGQPQGWSTFGFQLTHQTFDQQTVLSHGKCRMAFGLTIPPRNACQAMRDILDLNIERGRIEEIEPAAAQHALPGAAGIASQCHSVCLKLFGVR